MKTDRQSSGNAALDRLLGGGLELRTITQFYGGPASGKSTLCTIAAVSCLRAGGSVIYIDSEGFSIERFRQVAGSDTEALADRLFLFEPVDFEQQGSMIAESDKVLKLHKPGLLILDSATALYRTDLSSSGMRNGTNSRCLSPTRSTWTPRGTRLPALAACHSNTSQKRLSGWIVSKRPGGGGQRSSNTGPGPRALRSSLRSCRTGSGQKNNACISHPGETLVT